MTHATFYSSVSAIPKARIEPVWSCCSFGANAFEGVGVAAVRIVGTGVVGGTSEEEVIVASADKGFEKLPIDVKEGDKDVSSVAADTDALEASSSFLHSLPHPSPAP